MNVTVDITRIDYWEFNKFAMTTIPKYRTNFIINIIAIPVSSFVILLLMKLPFYYVLVSSVILGIISDMLLIYFMKKSIMKIPDGREGFLGKHVIEIRSDGLSETTSVNEGLHLWKGIRSIHQNEKYIFIFIDNLMAHIIPKRSFSSLKDAEDFYNLAIKYWEENK